MFEGRQSTSLIKQQKISQDASVAGGQYLRR